MTSEEAKDYIREWCPYDRQEEIIEALQQEHSKDTISRAWLKEAIHNFYNGLKHTPTEEDIQAYIDAAPPSLRKQETVTEFADRCRECGSMIGRQMKQKTARWIKDSPWAKPYCSGCGESCIGVHAFDCITTDFCPHCGAKMQPKGEE